MLCLSSATIILVKLEKKLTELFCTIYINEVFLEWVHPAKNKGGANKLWNCSEDEKGTLAFQNIFFHKLAMMG